MRVYKPDLWVLVKITSNNNPTYFKILGSWYGGFTSGDSWRFSSGCLSPQVDGDNIVWPQNSGSTYHVSKKNVGMNNYTSNIYSVLCDEARAQGAELTVVEFDDFVE